jgi:hypothetical protein
MTAVVTATYKGKNTFVKHLSATTVREQMAEVAVFKSEYHSFVKDALKGDVKHCSFTLKVGF